MDITFHSFIIFIINLLIFLSAILILVTLKGNKPYKVKKDILFIEKLILKILILSLYLILYLYELLKEGNSMINSIFLTKIISFNIYIILLNMNNFFMCLEDYFTYNSPTHYFNSLFHNTKYNLLYEIISIISSIFLSSIYIFKDNNYIRKLVILFDENNLFLEINANSPFIILNIGKLIFLLVFNIIILILYFILKFKLKKLIFKKREKLFRIFNRNLILTISYIFFIFFNIFLFFLEKIKKANNDNNIYRIINSYLFLFVFIEDSFFELITYSTSKFAQYKLKNTLVYSIGSIFNKDKEADHPTNSFLDSILQDQSHYNTTNKNNSNLDDEDEDNTLLMPLNSNDIELVLIYRNKIFIEDYFFYYYDYMMNITLSALFKVYTNKKFSPTVVNNNKLNTEMNITESEIFGIGEKTNNTYTSYSSYKKEFTIDGDNQINKNSDEFEFIKNSMRDDFPFSEEIFTNALNDFSYDNIKVKITSYFTTKCVSNLFDKNLTNKIIRQSLSSHIITDLNFDLENNNFKKNKNNISVENNFNIPYHSIISCNAKEEYFLNLKNILIRTYDKQLTFDIFESNDEEINLNVNNSNIKLATMLDEYFNYIKGRGVSGTFLPIIIGIFKVKINSFKTMLIYVSCNSIIENSPSKSFSYWQLIRFSSNNTKKVASSKYKHNVLIGDDLIFDRKNALPLVKEDNDSYYTIEIKNYFGFKETITHDINFLNKLECIYSNLIMMYFEYENTQKHEDGGAIKIRKTENNKAEIINATFTMPILNEEEEESDENIYIEDFSKKHDSEKATITSIPISSSEDNFKKNINTSDKNSILNSLTEDKKENIHINEKTDEGEENNINKNLDIEENKSMNIKDNEVKKTLTNNNGFPVCGSLNSNYAFLDDRLLSFDEPTGTIKNLQITKSLNMLNFKENIEINSYDGYFDNFNCLCLFSFENIFQIKSAFSCYSNNFNKFQDNILNYFSDYIPRKHTIISKTESNKK